jgi:hypothetical protein
MKIEDEILQACEIFLDENGISTRNMVLTFDGFMLPIHLFIGEGAKYREPKGLELLSDYVFEKTGYRVSYIIKAQEEIIDLTGLTMPIRTAPLDFIVNSDKAAAQVVINNILKGRIFTCNYNLYVKDFESDIWTCNKNYVDNFIARGCSDTNITMCYTNDTDSNKKKKRDCRMKILYTQFDIGISHVSKLIKIQAPVDNDLIEKIRNKSLHKIFFKNGVYDFKLRVFRDETDDDMTAIRINRNYNPNFDKSTYAEVIDILNSLFVSEKYDTLADKTRNMIQHISRGLAGDSHDKAWVIGLGVRNSGKSLLNDFCKACFGPYVGSFNANNFLTSKRIGSVDESKNLNWIHDLQYTRLCFSNEVELQSGDDKAIFSGNLIKLISSGGDTMHCRKLYENTQPMTFNMRMFFFLNSIPEIKPPDACQTVNLITFPNQYIPEDEYNLKKEQKTLLRFERKRDNTLKDRLKAEERYWDCFINMIFSEYIHEPVRNCESVKNFTQDFNEEIGDERTIFKRMLDFSDPNAFTSSKEIYNALNETNEFAQSNKISMIKIKYVLVDNFGLKDTRKDNIRGYVGVKIKQLEGIPNSVRT